jgi:hypothetical protein
MAFSLNYAILPSENYYNLQSVSLAFWIKSEAIILADNLIRLHSIAARTISFVDVKFLLIKENSLSVSSETSVSRIMVC